MAEKLASWREDVQVRHATANPDFNPSLASERKGYRYKPEWGRKPNRSGIHNKKSAPKLLTWGRYDHTMEVILKQYRITLFGKRTC